MYDKEKTVNECRIQKVGDKMATTKTSKRSQSSFHDKRFYENNIKRYPHDENLYLFKKDLVNKIIAASLEQLTDLKLDKKDNKDLLINNIEKLTINDDRHLILAANKLYNGLTLFLS